MVRGEEQASFPGFVLLAIPGFVVVILGVAGGDVAGDDLGVEDGERTRDRAGKDRVLEDVEDVEEVKGVEDVEDDVEAVDAVRKHFRWQTSP